MKKFLFAIFTLASIFCLALGLVGCDNGNGGSSDTTGDGSTTEQGGNGTTIKPDESDDENTDDHVHSFTDYIYNNDATCTEDGTETAKCSCGATDTRTKEGTALGHSMKTIDAKEPTCTKIGWGAYQECSRCHKKENYVEKAALGHDYEQFEAKPATCADAGYDAHQECKRCHDFMGEEVTFTPALHVQYELIGGAYAVTGISMDCRNQVIVLPETYMGYPVTEISTQCFEECSWIKSIILPNTLISIEDYAFYRCSGLESITIPEGVISIGNCAFV